MRPLSAGVARVPCLGADLTGGGELRRRLSSRLRDSGRLGFGKQTRPKQGRVGRRPDRTEARLDVALSQAYFVSPPLLKQGIPATSLVAGDTGRLSWEAGTRGSRVL